MPPKKRTTSSSADVQTARGRLKGALQDVVSIPDDEEEDSLPPRGRPPKVHLPKRIKTAPAPIHQAFIMKLFDRSVDLAKYNERTALYPICRAWMINQPRSAKIPNLNQTVYEPTRKRQNLSDIVDDLKTGKIVELRDMPAAKTDGTISRIPSPLPFQKAISKDNIDLDYDLDDPKFSKAELLKTLKENGTKVRKKWQEHTKAYAEARYGLSLSILDTIYKQ